MQVVEVESLRKVYGDVVAVDGISFEVHKGEIFGMVGPNGAGKTTTIECVEGLRRPTAGSVRTLGLNPQRDRRALMERIGVQLQESALPNRLKTGEALELFATFYERALPAADRDALLERLGLAEKRDRPFAKLSGGEKQRLFIALALVHDPELIFLDELTTGLDPHARRDMWDLVRDIRNQGKTVFLTTHYMEEAERLCDRVAIIDEGRIVELDTPENLIRSLGAEEQILFVADGVALADMNFLQDLPVVTRLEPAGERWVVYGRGDRFVGSVVTALEDHRIPFRDLRTRQPTLEDVFLARTGRRMNGNSRN
ncbi:MAG: ABC transporter ATP-binding protein [Chloroflexi bacterium]|nr:MAG: ABC transporter ATP-binding protein [Chloroflexota bacterium]